MFSELFQIIPKFRAAIELFKILFRRYVWRPFAEAGKLRGVLGGCGNKIWSLITPAAAHRLTLLEANDIFRWKIIKKIFQGDEPAATHADDRDLHPTSS